MNPVDAVVTALTPGSVFNQNGKVFRSAKALAQFASVEQKEILGLIAEHLADQVTIRPSAKRPENGPLIALTQFVPDQEEPAVVKIVAGNAVEANVEEPVDPFPGHPVPMKEMAADTTTEDTSECELLPEDEDVDNEVD